MEASGNPMQLNNKYKGVFFILLTALCFSTMNMFVRLAGPDIPSIEKSFFRNLVSLIFSFSIIIKSKEGFGWEKGNFPLITLRSVFGTIGLICNFYAVDHLVISDASLLNKMSTFYVLIFSFLFLKEKVKPYQWICVLTAFVGSLFVIKPSFHNAAIGNYLVGALGGICAGAAYTCVRALTVRGEKKSRIVFAFSLLSCLITGPLALINFKPLDFKAFAMLMLAGLAASGGQFAITTAYSYAPAKEIGVYDYTQILFTAIIGLIVFGEMPDALSFVGYVVIIGAGILMFFIDNGKIRLHSGETIHKQA